MKTMIDYKIKQLAIAKFMSLMAVALVLSFAYLVTGCLEPVSGKVGETTVITDPTEVLPPLTTPERTVCDPFNTNSPSARDRGIVATLAWLDKSMPPGNGQAPLQNVLQYFDIGHILQSLIYFDRIYVPTRKFDLGFTTEAGETILNDQGKPIYEYFALRMKGQFQLGVNEKPGAYQFAVLSDDGSVLAIQNENGDENILVDNDRDHSTRMACSTQTVQMSKDSKVPFVLDYYQGPRFHIALTVMWRPVPDGTDPNIPVQDQLCGKAGNGYFFNPNVVPSQPQQPFYEMLARGWKVLENENYAFPEQASNPCAPSEEVLTISGFQVTGVTRTSVTLNWLTSVDSNSQVEIKNVATGAIVQSSVDATLVKDHTLTVTGLSPNTLYSFKGISVTPGGQTAVSDERALRTPR